MLRSPLIRGRVYHDACSRARVAAVHGSDPRACAGRTAVDHQRSGHSGSRRLGNQHCRDGRPDWRRVGGHVQLSVHAPWTHRRDDGAGWSSGTGPVEFGVRWRFLDQAQAGVSVAVQPMLIRSFSGAAERRGLNSPDPEFVLPLQVSRHFEHGAIGTEIARHVVANQQDTWQAGAFVEYDCRPMLQCLGEINTNWEDGVNTILNAGARQALTPHVNLLGSIGTQISGQEGTRAKVVFYLGAQLVF